MMNNRLLRYCSLMVWLLGGFLLPGKAFAQQYSWRNRIDQVVHLADSLFMVSQFTFHLKKFDSKERRINETWHYTLYGREVIIFEVHYFVDSLEHDEVYYLDKGQLVCMEEYEILNPFTPDDEIVWGSVGFFTQQNLRQHIKIGHRPARSGGYDDWDALKKFRDRYRELREHRSLQEKNVKEAIFAP